MRRSEAFKAKDKILEQLADVLPKDNWLGFWEAAMLLEQSELYSFRADCSSWLILEVAKKDVLS